MKKILILTLSTVVFVNHYLKTSGADKLKQLRAATQTPKEQVLTEEWIIGQLFANAKSDTATEMKLSGWTNPKS